MGQQRELHTPGRCMALDFLIYASSQDSWWCSQDNICAYITAALGSVSSVHTGTRRAHDIVSSWHEAVEVLQWRHCDAASDVSPAMQHFSQE